MSIRVTVQISGRRSPLRIFLRWSHCRILLIVAIYAHGFTPLTAAENELPTSNTKLGTLLSDVVFYYSFDTPRLQGDGSIAPVVANGAVPVPGVHGQGLFFDGHSWLKCVPVERFAFDGSVTISMWLKLPPQEKLRRIGDRQRHYLLINSSWSNPGGFIVDLNSKTGGITVTGSGGSWTAESDRINDERWHHLVIRVGVKLGDVWVDNVKIGSGKIKRFAETSEPLFFGRASHTDEEMFCGTIDDLAVWDRVLTADQVGLLFGDAAPMKEMSGMPNRPEITEVTNSKILTAAKAAYQNPDEKKALRKLYALMSRQPDREAYLDILVAVTLGCHFHGERDAYKKVQSYLKIQHDDQYREILHRIDLTSACSKCNGSGQVNQPCKRCKGSGVCSNSPCKNGKIRVPPSFGSTRETTRKCPVCDGSSRCQLCHGNGQHPVDCGRCGADGKVRDKNKFRIAYQTTLEASLNRLCQSEDLRFINGEQVTIAQYKTALEERRRAGEIERERQAQAEEKQRAQGAQRARAAANLSTQQAENGEALGNWLWRKLANDYAIRGVTLTNRADVSELRRHFRQFGNVYVTDGRQFYVGFSALDRVEVLFYDVGFVNQAGLVWVDDASIYVGYNKRSATATLLHVEAVGLTLNGILTPVKSLSEKMLGEAFDQIRR